MEKAMDLPRFQHGKRFEAGVWGRSAWVPASWQYRQTPAVRQG